MSQSVTRMSDSTAYARSTATYDSILLNQIVEAGAQGERATEPVRAFCLLTGSPLSPYTHFSYQTLQVSKVFPNLLFIFKMTIHISFPPKRYILKQI